MFPNTFRPLFSMPFALSTISKFSIDNNNTMKLLFKHTHFHFFIVHSLGRQVYAWKSDLYSRNGLWKFCC